MPLTIRYKQLPEYRFDYPFRCFVSGSSQSGKTFFAHKLLKTTGLFCTPLEQVVYYHPDYLSHVPVNWHNSLKIPVTYQSNLPTLQEICELKPNTCLVLDDLFEECINSTTIDYLFRVLSGKNRLSVLILSQRYFSAGKFGLNIRNNCNYTVLMRNVDSKLNVRIASLLSLKIPILKAIEHTYETNYYPYIFIDSTPRGQVSTYRCYTDIFSHARTVYNQTGMKAYIISEHDFLSNFDILNNTTATKNGKHPESSVREYQDKLAEESDTCRETSEAFTEKIRARRKKLRKRRRITKNL